nr:MAG TPA: hypothetical protein [Caudoviricetes sp.]
MALPWSVLILINSPYTIQIFFPNIPILQV